MNKFLKVVKPFFVMEVGDTFELTKDGTGYESTFNMDRHEADDANSAVYSSYTSNYVISTDYAKLLIEDGYLEPVRPESKSNAPFVNVFDEISNMLETYKEDLANLDDDMANEPACLKVEKETVLRNLIVALEHLNSLKK